MGMGGVGNFAAAAGLSMIPFVGPGLAISQLARGGKKGGRAPAPVAPKGG
jgi:hypothetical protein